MTTPIVPQKRCTKCGQGKPATSEHFSRDATRRDGLNCWCKTCQRENARHYRAENPEKKRESSRRWRAANPNKERERRHRYVAEHPEKARESSRRYYAEHPEKARESSRRWATENPDQRATYERNRRARNRAAEGAHTVADIQAQLKRQKGKCHYCDCKMTAKPHLPNSQTVEHVVPVTRDGRNAPDNIVIACRTCNFSKGAKLPHEWPEGGRLL